MNILLLTADSLRVDRTSLSDHHRDTTPFLASLVDEGFAFQRAYANGRNTAASFPAVHTSTHASFYQGHGLPPSGTPTLAERLNQAGYDTFAVHTNELLSSDYNYDRGFNTYLDSRQSGDSENASWRTVARDFIGDDTFLFELIKRAHFFSTEHFGIKIFNTADSTSGFGDTIVERLVGTDHDSFVWAHYMEPHHPYEPPAKFQKSLGLEPISRREATKLSRKMRLRPQEITPTERQTIQGLYDAAVLSWDQEIESTYQALEDASILDDTIIAITADHGELLGEEGRYGHPPVLEQELLRIPLVFVGPHIDSDTSDTQVGLVDLAPTLLCLVDEDVPSEYRGRALFDNTGSLRELPSRPQFCETGSGEQPRVCGIEGDRKLSHDITTDQWTSLRLSDLDLTEECTEATYPELKEAIVRHERAAEDERQRGAGVDDETLQDDLAALGYLEQ